MRGFQTNASLVPHTTFKSGGTAEYFAVAHSESELKTLLTEAAAADQPVTILGGGSNVLVSDTGIRGCVIAIKITGYTSEQHDGLVLVTVSAGEVWDDVVAQTVVEGWWGIENLSAIPGSVGAFPVQNVGAYGVEAADVVHSVRAIHKTSLTDREFTADDCQFGYRDSWFKTEAGKDWIITAVTLRLSASPLPVLTYQDLKNRFSNSTPTQAEIRATVTEIRADKFPDWQSIGTAGSFFKNPIISKEDYKTIITQYPTMPHYNVDENFVKVPLGWVLDNICRLRGYYEKAVGCYEGQALVIVNTGTERSEDIYNFARKVARTVFEKTGISIEWEVTTLGDFSRK